MTRDSRAISHARLTDLVVELCGVDRPQAHHALADAVARHGDAGDQLLNVADAIIMLRHEPAEISAPM